jgi:uncharacterized protein (DUF1810 family)
MINYNLFLYAQENVYQNALEELKQSKKRSHWMWFIFPQIKGLGSSEMAIKYSLSDIEEAQEYLRHPVLGARIIECVYILLNGVSKNADDIFGFPDNLKLKSSLTLFWLAENQNKDSVFKKMLDIFFQGEVDKMTMKILNYS